jgi:hemerythrin
MIGLYWSDRFTVGNEKIDNEHKVFMDLVRSSSAAIDSHNDTEYVGRYLEELKLYAHFHFFSEETIMINSGYPNYESHRQAHLELLDTLDKKICEYKKNTESGESLIEFIYEWFVSHIMTVDKKLVSHL